MRGRGAGGGESAVPHLVWDDQPPLRTHCPQQLLHHGGPLAALGCTLAEVATWAACTARHKTLGQCGHPRGPRPPCPCPSPSQTGAWVGTAHARRTHRPQRPRCEGPRCPAWWGAGPGRNVSSCMPKWLPSPATLSRSSLPTCPPPVRVQGTPHSGLSRVAGPWARDRVHPPPTHTHATLHGHRASSRGRGADRYVQRQVRHQAPQTRRSLDMLQALLGLSMGGGGGGRS